MGSKDLEHSERREVHGPVDACEDLRCARFKAHRWLYHSTLGSRVTKKKKKSEDLRCGSGARVSGAGCRVWGLGCRVEGFGFPRVNTYVAVKGSGFRVQGAEFGVEGFRVSGFGFNILRTGWG